MRSFGPCALSPRHLHALATKVGEISGLVGSQVAAVTNFPPKRVAGVKSEVLVLGTVSDEEGVVLLHPTFPVANGTIVA